MDKFEATYHKTLEVQRRYEAAKAQKSEELQEAAKAEYRAIVDSLCGSDDVKGYVWRHYITSRQYGNAFLDFDGIVLPRKVPDLIKVLRAAGVERFALSDPSTGLINAALAFQKQNCLLEGIVEINDRPDFFSNKIQKKPALIFKVG